MTKNASETTIATALLLAAEIMNHQPLIIKGSEEFKKEVLKTAVLQDLPISFDDLLMQIEFMHNKYEAVGNRRYVEIEFALPNEQKTVEQYRQIINAFIAKHLSDHYFAYAIHNKIGMLSGQRYPHVHIMFSERMIDEVEKKKERAACNFFKYPIRKNVEASFEERRKHGAPKNRNWANKNFLPVLRADFAQIQNEVLERNGFSIRVDHRSLEAQKEEAKSNGDTIFARLFSRVPEKYIGVISCQENDEPRLERLKIFRGLRKQHFDMVMKLDALTKEADELEIKDAVQLAFTHAKELVELKNLK